MVWIEKDGQKEKKIKRRTCRFDTTIGTVFKFFVIMCFILLWVGCASAATLVVSKTSPACTSGDEYFTSIQAAVDRAQEGDEIVVCPGTYVENILVDKSLTIWSENGYDSTIVRTADTEDAVFEVTADYVAISGFTVEGATGWLKSGIYLYDSDYCKLSNNNCSNNGYGIYIESSNNNSISNNNCSNNGAGIYLYRSNSNIVNNNTANYNEQHYGISLKTSNNNAIIGNNASNNFQSGVSLSYSNNNTIKGNIANSNKNYNGNSLSLSSSNNNEIIGNNASYNIFGIYLYNSSSNTIKGNRAKSNKYFGIYLFSSNNNEIIENNASNNTEAGVILRYSNNNTIRGNIANSNRLYGIAVDHPSNNNKIIDNNASNNVWAGICLYYSRNSTIKGNTANSNRYNGITLSSSDNNEIIENNASNNMVDGISLSNSNNNTIKGNAAIHNFNGIVFPSSDDNNVTNNIIYLSLGDGISLTYSFGNNISNNIINSNYVSGVSLSYGSKNIIINNIINSNKGRGLSFQWISEKNNVLNNFIDSNGGQGIAFISSSSINISGNTISSNYLEGILIDKDSYYNEIYHNNLVNNEVDDETLKNLWYGNYLSDYAGIDVDGDGIGDTNIPHPKEGYDFYPFINRDGWLTMSVWPHYLDFGKVYQGTIINHTFNITNYGNSKLTIYSIKTDPIITISGIELPAEISKGHSQSFNMSLNTEELGGFVLKNIEIISNDIENPDKKISIFGFVEIPASNIEIKEVDYQSRVIKGQINLFKVTINNTGDFREKNVSIEFKAGYKSLGNATITNIESKETKSAIFKWDTSDVSPKTYDLLIEVKLKDKPLPLASLTVSVKVDMPSAAQTLILTNRKRLADCWGVERAEKLENELIKLSYHVSVAAIPVYVEENEAVASAYESWDLNLQDPQSANNVSKRIKKLIDAKLKEYTGIKYIIIVGDDRIIPFYRIPDNTDKPFRPELWQTVDEYHKVNIDSAVGSAFHNKMFLTDNIYATNRPMEWKTADVIIPELFVPDIPIGRLVERPEDISAVIAAFYQKEYVNPDRIFVTGYDFMSDSASVCSSTLENKTKGTTTTIISQKAVAEKYFDEIKDELLNTSNNIVLLFQHAEHDLFNIPKKCQVGSENITSQIISTAAGLNGSIVCSLGCHSGLNVPPNASTDDFDLAQAFAQRGVLAYIAPTSYSIGLQRTIGAHELLITYFTQYLCAGMDVGTALTRAKQEYWATNYDISYIDEQVLESTTLYGLPMARINVPRLNTSYNESGMKIMSFVRGKPDILVISPTYSTINISTMLTLPITYYKSESGELFLEPNAPVQPKEIRVFYPTPTRMLHGAVLTSAKYTVKSIIPLIDAYMQSPVWIGKSGSPVIDNWCPAQIFKLKSLCYPQAPMESRQYLIVVTGQYKGPTRVTPYLEERKERLYDELSFQLYYASPDDETKPPEIKDVSSNRVNDTINITVNVWDKSSIQRVLVTYTDINGEWGEWRSKDCKHEEGDLWACSISAKEAIEFFVQAVDKNGNVAVGNVWKSKEINGNYAFRTT